MKELGAKVRASFLASDRTYGARRVWRDLLTEGISCGLHRIERLMRLQALKARPRRRRLPPDLGERQAAAVAPNVLERTFEASAPNRKWIADFTYVWTAEGWLYVAAVIDLFSRRVVGWSMSAAMTAQLVTDPGDGDLAPGQAGRARDVNGLGVVKTVWAEFISDDPMGEVTWAQELAHTTGRPQGMIGLVDFSSPEIERTSISTHRSSPFGPSVNISAGIQPIRCSVMRQGPNSCPNTVWQDGLALLRGRHLRCEIEIFGSQLPEFASVAASYPDIQFVLPVMGWPIDLTNEGHGAWKRALATASACDNVAIKIFGMHLRHPLDDRTDPTVDPRCRRAVRSRPLHVREPPANLQAGLQRSATIRRLS
jgi:hypothetical protein